MAKIGQRTGGSGGGSGGTRTVSGGGGTPAVHLEQNGNADLGLVIGLQHEEAGPDWGFFGTARRNSPTLPHSTLQGQSGGSLVIRLPERFIRPSLVSVVGDWNVRVIQGQPAVAEVTATSASFDIRTSATVNKGIRVTLAPGAAGSDASFSIQRITTGSTSRNISSGRVLQVFILTTSTAAEVLGQFYTTAGDTTSGLVQLSIPQVGATPARGVNIQSVAYFGPAGDVEDGTSVIGGLTMSQIAGRTVANNLNVNFVPAQHGTSGRDGTPAVTRTPLAASLDVDNQRLEITALATDTITQVATAVRAVAYPIRYDFDPVDGYSQISGTSGAFSESGLVAVTTGTDTLSSAAYFHGVVGNSSDVAFSTDGVDRQTILATADESAETVSLRYHSSDSQQTLLGYLNELEISDANVTLYAAEKYGTNLSTAAEAPPINGRPFDQYFPEGSTGSGSGSAGLNTAAVDQRIRAITTKPFIDALNVDADTLDGFDSSVFASAGSGSLVVTHKGTNTFDPITATSDITVDDIWYVVAGSGTTGDLVGRENKLVRRTAPNTYDYESPKEGSIHDLTNPAIDTDDDQPILERIMFRAGEWRATSEGIDNTSSGIVAHAEGEGNTASGRGAHAEGRGNVASGDYSHAQGLNNEARGTASYAGGDDSRAVGQDSFAHGESVTAIPVDSFILGKDGVLGNNFTKFGVANGSEPPDETVRSTAKDFGLVFKVTDQGDVYAANFLKGDVDTGVGLSILTSADAATDLGGGRLSSEYSSVAYADAATYATGPDSGQVMFNSDTVATATEFKIHLQDDHVLIFDALVNSNKVGTGIDFESILSSPGDVWCGELISASPTTNNARSLTNIRTIAVTPNANNPELGIGDILRVVIHGHWEVEVDARIQEALADFVPSSYAAKMRIFPETLSQTTDFEGTHLLILDELDETVLNNSAIDTFRLDHPASNTLVSSITWTLSGGNRELQITVDNATWLGMRINSAEYIELEGVFYDDINTVEIAKTAPLLIPVQHNAGQFPASKSDIRTDEEIRDTVASFIQGGSNVTVTHDDAADTLTIDSTASGGGSADPKTLVSALQWGVSPNQLSGRTVSDFQRTFRLEFDSPSFDLSSYYFEPWIGGQMVHARTQWSNSFTHFDATVDNTEATAISGAISSTDRHVDVEIRFYADSTTTPVSAVTTRRLSITEDTTNIQYDTVATNGELGSHLANQTTRDRPQWLLATADVSAIVDSVTYTYTKNQLIYARPRLAGARALFTLPEEAVAATEDIAGLVEKATTAEMAAGTADKYPDAAVIKAYVDANAGSGGGQTEAQVDAAIEEALPPFAKIEFEPDSLPNSEFPNSIFVKLDQKLTTREIDGLSLNFAGVDLSPHSSTPISSFNTETRAFVRFDLDEDERERLSNNHASDQSIEPTLTFSFTTGADETYSSVFLINNPSASATSSALTAHEANPSAHQDSPRRQPTLGLNAPVGRRIYLTTAITHPPMEHIFSVALGNLPPNNVRGRPRFTGASVVDFSAAPVNGPQATSDTSGFPAIMNAQRVAGIWQDDLGGSQDIIVAIAATGALSSVTPTHLHIAGDFNDIHTALTQVGNVVDVGGTDYRIMRTTRGGLAGQLDALINNSMPLVFSLQYATGYLTETGTIDTGVDHTVGEYVSIGSGQWIGPIAIQRPPMELQAAVDASGNTVGSANITLPTNYTDWRYLSIDLRGADRGRIGGTTLRTATIAAQTANRNFVVSGTLDTGNTSNVGFLNYTQSTRILAAENNDRIIYAELHD